MSGSGKSGDPPGGTGSTSRTTSSRARSMLRVKNSTQAWVKRGGATKRHRHLETILKAARGVVIALAVNLVLTIGFVTQPQGFARAFFGFGIWHTIGWVGLIILKYYRNAIAAGAMKRRAHDTTKGSTLSDEKTISNTSVVPIAEAKSGSSEQSTAGN